MTSIVWQPEKFRGYHAALILTDHDEVDYATLVQETPLVVDTRNATTAITPEPGNVIKA